MKNYKTPIEQIFFRSSKIGLLCSGLKRQGLTSNQREEMERLEALKIEPIGLTAKQAEDLQRWDNAIKSGKTITPGQMEKRDDYRSRLTTPKGLTPTQATRLETLKEINSRPPELTDGAKSYIREVWLENEKGFKEEVTDKKLRKGIQAEEDAINLISFVDDVMYVKNEDRIKKDRLTGECDVQTIFKEFEFEGKMYRDVKVIDDTKCSWSPRTFMNAKLTTDYEWQLVAYMYLYDADFGRLRHCLVDCPPDVLMDEYKKYCFQHNIIDDALPEYQPLIEQFDRNYLYENSGLYTKEERVKTYVIQRDMEQEEILKLAVKLGIEYYKSITLNGEN